MMLTAQLKADWVKALRSGDYMQSSGVLCRIKDNYKEYCCLGVLCELQGNLSTYPEMPQHAILFDKYSGSNNYLDNNVIDLAIQKHLAIMNDDRQNNFNEIADYIEQNIPSEG